MSHHRLTARWALAFACVALFTAPAFAQEARTAVPTGPLTLEQALNIAEETSESLAAARAGISRATAEQLRARSGRKPQLSATASYDRALASEFSGVFDSNGITRCDPFMLNPTAPLDARVAEIERAIDCGAIGASFFGGGGGDGEEDGGNDLPFGRENTWRFSLSFSQSLYSGGRFGALDDIADAGLSSAELAYRASRAQLLFDVTQAYYDAALSDRLVAIAEATFEQAESTLRQVQASFDAGAQPEFELLRARVSRDNQRPAIIRQRVNRDVALLRLKQLLDLPVEADLQLAAALTGDAVPPPVPFAEALARQNAVAMTPTAAAPAAPAAAPAVNGEVLPERNAVREADTLVRLREASYDAARAERKPNVTLNSSFSQIAYPTNFFPTGDFRTNWSVGAFMQVPIMTGGRLRAAEQVAEAELQQSKAQLRQVQELAALDARSAWAELEAAQAAWEASTGTIQQAARAYEIAEVRYSAGVSTQLELTDARLLLQQTEANRAQAARDLQVARARFALLPDLPIGAGSGGGRSMPQTQPSLSTPATPATPQTPAGGQLRNANSQAGPNQTGGRQ